MRLFITCAADEGQRSVLPISACPPSISDRFPPAISPTNLHIRYDSTSNREK